MASSSEAINLDLVENTELEGIAAATIAWMLKVNSLIRDPISIGSKFDKELIWRFTLSPHHPACTVLTLDKILLL